MRELGLLLPAGLTLFALVGLLFVWQVQKRAAPDNTLAAKATEPAKPELVQPPLSSPEPAPAPVEEAVASPQASPAEPGMQPAADSADQSNEPVPSESVLPVTEPALPVEARVVNATPLKLQAILYHPKWPSAMINGKTVRTGDRVGDITVLKIQRSSATVLYGGRTNILELPE